MKNGQEKKIRKADPRETVKNRKPAEPEENEEEEGKPHATPIFLYLQLQSASNLPVLEVMPHMEHRLEIELKHASNKITKLQDHYTIRTDFDLSQLDKMKPTFSITIQQDSIEDLNIFSDNPLVVTLYEHIIPIPIEEESGKEEGEEENSPIQLVQPVQEKPNPNKNMVGVETDEEVENVEEERWLPIAQGNIDLLQFFTTKRAIFAATIFLYTVSKCSIDRNNGAFKTEWQIYTLNPLLKELSICNIVFLTLESIYNAKPDLIKYCDELMVDLSFQSTMRNVQNVFDKIKLCSYTAFSKQAFVDQSIYETWATLKTSDFTCYDGIGLRTGCRMKHNKIFTNLLKTEDADIDIDAIDTTEDTALACNSLHRYALNQELMKTLEDVIAFNEQQLLIELYKRDDPDNILMQGTLDPSILLYPKVNVCRFAVALNPVVAAPTFSVSTNQAAGKNKKNSKHLPKDKTTFVTISICLLSPVTFSPVLKSLFDKVGTTNAHILTCKSKRNIAVLKTKPLCMSNYKTFDELVGALIDYIVEKEIKTIDDAKTVFCCQLKNMTNTILKLIACDFNVRFPTKTSIEFNNLMTTVYKELVQRVYNILQDVRNDDVAHPYNINDKTLEELIKFTNAMKYTYEVGDEHLGDIYFEKIRKLCPTGTLLHYFTFIYDLEKLRFDSAKEYTDRPLSEKYTEGQYFTDFATIYIGYNDTIKSGDPLTQSLEFVINELIAFIQYYPKGNIDAWILLHCLYSSCGYLPGMSYTRLNYEQMFKSLSRDFPELPKSLWAIYNNFELNMKTHKGKKFYEVVKTFLNLGLYRFAEIVFHNIANECTETERYFMITTFKILLNEVPQKYAAKNVTADKMINANQIKAFQALINGNLEYSRGATDTAMKNYERLLDIKGLEDYENFQLGLLRLGYKMIAGEKYEKATNAFQKGCSMNGEGVIANFGLGKAMYRLNRLKDADMYFSKCTNDKIHIPDVWGFLALVNLKIGDLYKALEFWKYAKLNPDNIISEEILQELQEVNYDDVLLYVDKPL